MTRVPRSALCLRILSLVLLGASISLTLIGYGLYCESGTGFVDMVMPVKHWQNYALYISPDYYTLYVLVIAQASTVLLILGSFLCIEQKMCTTVILISILLITLLSTAVQVWASKFFGITDGHPAEDEDLLELSLIEPFVGDTDDDSSPNVPACVNISWVTTSVMLFMVAVLISVDIFLTRNYPNDLTVTPRSSSTSCKKLPGVCTARYKTFESPSVPTAREQDAHGMNTKVSTIENTTISKPDDVDQL